MCPCTNTTNHYTHVFVRVCVYIEDTNLVVVSGRQGGPLNLFMSLLHDSVVSPSILM